ncbi:protein 3-oxoalanine-generating enzyme family protein and SAM-dependent methyltransferase [Citrifermentans bemidjiense Bem]|uniref:Protein 3-oxoalanine-generating enzyme family protein and SAM-dependent methyltransferase n=1 Tax=Citrifermentans bemidjiense (strain ATCC BAA-1014 / DSM 16622 / JCM 12645 / Bem) TaxID=404380 RepID=B5EJ60_CITBB|nr:5-histidylcysteine sulfoxide synthase [Citrifermentans bemidjiense]ACH37086.1 protein 3-oxoalanine-generating enzyme family protein and SAM-dependent methyltransferase [Citrifermentans bemidjiense Bem]
MDLRKTHSVILTEGDPEQKRSEILDYFHATFTIDERLYETLKDESTFYLKGDHLRHPLIFYYGHTATFFINKLIIARVIDRRVNPRFESLFAVGVDEMSWDDLNESHYDWPTPGEVKRYRDQVRDLVDGLIKTLPLTLPITWEHPFWAIMMGIEHERIHLETSSVLIRQLPLDQVRRHDFWEICRESGEPAANELLPVAAGRVRLGKDEGHPLYGWDNEYGSREAKVEAFSASKFLVSNREYLAFVKAGGYRERGWWTEEGWNWRSFKQAEHPLFWVEREWGWGLRTMLEIIDLPWNWPVEVNYLEAKAFCNWLSAKSGKSIRLPTEDEWYHLRDLAGVPDQPGWSRAPGNINLEYWASSCPVGRFAFGDFFDLIGNVWQWTETPIYPFHGFRVHPWYDDFSTPTFDTRHNLIKGGSWISTGNEATRDSRYAFRRHFFQHAGFRYVESAHPVEIHEDPYETDALAAQYCDAHYGPEHFGVPNFPRACAEICLELTRGRSRGHALDLGCAVGRASFELARGFDQVTGLDFSSRFFRLAARMQDEGFLRYALPEEGEVVSFNELELADLGLKEVRERVEFFQADACNLPDKFTGYDLVLAANLIDRLYSPRRFLAAIRERLNPGGLLVIASPYTWLEEYTKKDEWLGGYREAGEPVWTIDGLSRELLPYFTPLGAPREIPFVIRETRRKFQYSIAQLTVWELK